MTRPAQSALVLQGGGALGAFEFGATQALYEKKRALDVIAGVSIGAVTAVLLARPAQGLGPLEALGEFWKEVTWPYSSFFGNPHFFTLRPDFLTWPFSGLSWTHFYETKPLRDTLKALVDLDKLKQPDAEPLLLVSATNVKEGQIEYFDSRQGDLSLDHILASSSLPPAFPMTTINDTPYWDGGLFDNTPLGAVLDRLDPAADAERIVYVINLFPNKGPVPQNMLGVTERMKNLQFANKTLQDLELLCRFNEVAELIKLLESSPQVHAMRQHEAYVAVKKRGYIHIPRIVSITPPQPASEFGDADFSPNAIKRRKEQGYAEAIKALSAPPQDPCSALPELRSWARGTSAES
jgi:NTE family protein